MQPVVLAVLAVLVLISPSPAFPESSEDLKALGREIAALRAGQKAIQRDLQQLRVILHAVVTSAAGRGILDRGSTHRPPD